MVAMRRSIPSINHQLKFTINFHLQDVLPIAPAVAIGAADEDVAEKLHFDFFEPGAAATFALALRGIEAERTGIQTALLREIGLREHFADVVERADVNRRIRPRCLAED